jgi:hypothetical protein
MVSDAPGDRGDAVIARGYGEADLQRKPRRRSANTAQPAAENPWTQAMSAYNAMAKAQSQIWNRYAATLTYRDPVTGAACHTTGQKVFVVLSTAFLQVNPGSTIPLVPPTVPFAGDNAVVTATGRTGQIIFTASSPNAAPAKTEILLQPLKGAHDAPNRSYTSAGFVAFVASDLTHAISAKPGRYACAYHFVNTATGQMTEPIEIGVVQVTAE